MDPTPCVLNLQIGQLCGLLTVDLEVVVDVPHESPQPFPETHPFDQSQLTTKALFGRVPSKAVHDVTKPCLVLLPACILQTKLRAKQVQ
jgi:hypothetical protein